MSAATPEQSPQRASIIGAALVVTAVAIGAVLLIKGYGADGGLIATSKAPVTSSTTTPAPTTTLPERPPAEISVAVFNATGGGMVATKNQTLLLGKGFVNVSIADATSIVPETEIFYAPGAKSDAQVVARALGKDPQLVQPMPVPPPVDIGTATVAVLAGPDLA